MATQYTGGQVAGGVLTAATLNSIGAAWETWSPTISASSGTLSTVTVTTARYARVNKIVTGQLIFSITNVGTGSGVPQFTLPITAVATAIPLGTVGVYRETQGTGLTGVVALNTVNTALLFRYDNVNHLATSRTYSCSFTYEAA